MQSSCGGPASLRPVPPIPSLFRPFLPPCLVPHPCRKAPVGVPVARPTTAIGLRVSPEPSIPPHDPEHPKARTGS